MNFLSRYIEGECEAVYKEIFSLGDKAFDPILFPEINSVLKETFERVKFNLDIIYAELDSIGYIFAEPACYNGRKPITPPEPNTEVLLQQLKYHLGAAAEIPLSLQYFYKVAGSCNFCWNYESNDDIPWEGADPLDMPALKDLIEMYENAEPETDYDGKDLLLAGDSLTKDNISGSTYNIKIHSKQTIDTILLHEDWNIPFIEYLRITFNNCGFSMADSCQYESLRAFCAKVRPLLRPI